MFVVSRVFKFLGVGRALFIHPDRRAHRLPDDDLRAVVRGDPVAEDRRQRPRLLARQHDEAGAVAADEPRSQVQSQAGGRFVLRPRGRRPPGGHRLCGRIRGALVNGVCRVDRGLRVRLVSRQPGPEEEAGRPSSNRATRRPGCRPGYTFFIADSFRAGYFRVTFDSCTISGEACSVTMASSGSTRTLAAATSCPVPFAEESSSRSTKPTS